ASDDAIRSLVISHKLLGTGEWFVIHHTDCGMETPLSECAEDLGWRNGSWPKGSRLKRMPRSSPHRASKKKREPC
ncbi:MAG: hypothetical protein WBN02_02370, partial [Sedimenticolaceae bacterium]